MPEHQQDQNHQQKIRRKDTPYKEFLSILKSLPKKTIEQREQHMNSILWRHQPGLYNN